MLGLVDGVADGEIDLGIVSLEQELINEIENENYERCDYLINEIAKRRAEEDNK